MVVIVFRARLKPQVDHEALAQVGQRMYEIASSMPGYISYKEFPRRTGRAPRSSNSSRSKPLRHGASTPSTRRRNNAAVQSSSPNTTFKSARQCEITAVGQRTDPAHMRHLPSEHRARRRRLLPVCVWWSDPSGHSGLLALVRLSADIRKSQVSGSARPEPMESWVCFVSGWPGHHDLKTGNAEGRRKHPQRIQL